MYLNQKNFICETCGISHNGEYATGRFCSRHCANSYSSSFTKSKTKIVICPLCNKKHTVDIHSKNDVICGSCKNIKNKYDETTVIGKFVRSGLYNQQSKNLKKLGFDFSKNVEDEYFKLQKFLLNEYTIEHKSANQIEKEFNLAQNCLTKTILKEFNIDKRNISESLKEYLAYNDVTRGHTRINHIS